jgi:CRP-like cAMP-binding protein
MALKGGDSVAPMSAQGIPATGFLAALSPEDRAAVLSRSGQRRFRAGACLMHEGQAGTEVILLVSGRVKITYLTSEGREIVLDFRGPGELLGELSVIDGGPRSSTVEAMEPVEALAIAAADFKALMNTRPGIAVALLRNMTDRFRDADRKRIEFGASHTIGRVAARLAELADRYGEPSGRGIVIELPITQEELAGWTSSSREAVAKALRTLRKLGLIETERRRITVLDRDELQVRAG